METSDRTEIDLAEPFDTEDNSVDLWVSFINEWAESKGWNEDKNKNFGEQCMLMVTELSEAYESYRNHDPVAFIENGKPEGAAIELADCVIRILHWFGENNISLQQMLEIKMAYNQKRPYRHGGKRT